MPTKPLPVKRKINQVQGDPYAQKMLQKLPPPAPGEDEQGYLQTKVFGFPDWRSHIPGETLVRLLETPYEHWDSVFKPGFSSIGRHAIVRLALAIKAGYVHLPSVLEEASEQYGFRSTKHFTEAARKLGLGAMTAAQERSARFGQYGPLGAGGLRSLPSDLDRTVAWTLLNAATQLTGRGAVPIEEVPPSLPGTALEFWGRSGKGGVPGTYMALQNMRGFGPGLARATMGMLEPSGMATFALFGPVGRIGAALAGARSASAAVRVLGQMLGHAPAVALNAPAVTRAFELARNGDVGGAIGELTPVLVMIGGPKIRQYAPELARRIVQRWAGPRGPEGPSGGAARTPATTTTAPRTTRTRTQRPQIPKGPAPEPQKPEPPTPVTPAAPTGQHRLPRELAGAKPRYGYSGSLYQVEFKDDVSKALYIVSQTSRKSARDADYMAFLRTVFPGESDAQIRARGTHLRDNVIKPMARAQHESGTTSGKLVIPEQPHDAVHAKAPETATQPATTTKTEPKTPPQTQGIVQPPQTTAQAQSPKLPKELAGAKPRYQTRELDFEDDVMKALYIVRNRQVRSRRDADYMAFLRKVFPGMPDDKIRELGDSIANVLVRASVAHAEEHQLKGPVKIPKGQLYRAEGTEGVTEPAANPEQKGGGENAAVPPEQVEGATTPNVRPGERGQAATRRGRGQSKSNQEPVPPSARTQGKAEEIKAERPTEAAEAAEQAERAKPAPPKARTTTTKEPPRIPEVPLYSQTEPWPHYVKRLAEWYKGHPEQTQARYFEHFRVLPDGSEVIVRSAPSPPGKRSRYAEHVVVTRPDGTERIIKGFTHENRDQATPFADEYMRKEWRKYFREHKADQPPLTEPTQPERQQPAEQNKSNGWTLQDDFEGPAQSRIPYRSRYRDPVTTHVSRNGHWRIIQVPDTDKWELVHIVPERNTARPMVRHSDPEVLARLAGEWEQHGNWGNPEPYRNEADFQAVKHIAQEYRDRYGIKVAPDPSAGEAASLFPTRQSGLYPYRPVPQTNEPDLGGAPPRGGTPPAGAQQGQPGLAAGGTRRHTRAANLDISVRPHIDRAAGRRAVMQNREALDADGFAARLARMSPRRALQEVAQWERENIEHQPPAVQFFRTQALLEALYDHENSEGARAANNYLAERNLRRAQEHSYLLDLHGKIVPEIEDIYSNMEEDPNQMVRALIGGGMQSADARDNPFTGGRSHGLNSRGQARARAAGERASTQLRQVRQTFREHTSQQRAVFNRRYRDVINDAAQQAAAYYEEHGDFNEFQPTINTGDRFVDTFLNATIRDSVGRMRRGQITPERIAARIREALREPGVAWRIMQDFLSDLQANSNERINVEQAYQELDRHLPGFGDSLRQYYGDRELINANLARELIRISHLEPREWENWPALWRYPAAWLLHGSLRGPLTFLKLLGHTWVLPVTHALRGAGIAWQELRRGGGIRGATAQLRTWLADERLMLRDIFRRGPHALEREVFFKLQDPIVRLGIQAGLEGDTPLRALIDWGGLTNAGALEGIVRSRLPFLQAVGRKLMLGARSLQLTRLRYFENGLEAYVHLYNQLRNTHYSVAEFINNADPQEVREALRAVADRANLDSGARSSWMRRALHWRFIFYAKRMTALAPILGGVRMFLDPAATLARIIYNKSAEWNGRSERTIAQRYLTERDVNDFITQVIVRAGIMLGSQAIANKLGYAGPNMTDWGLASWMQPVIPMPFVTKDGKLYIGQATVELPAGLADVFRAFGAGFKQPSGERLVGYAYGQFTPELQNLWNLVFGPPQYGTAPELPPYTSIGKEVRQYRGEREQTHKEPMKWMDWLIDNVMPIPVAEAIRTRREEAKALGISKDQFDLAAWEILAQDLLVGLGAALGFAPSTIKLKGEQWEVPTGQRKHRLAGVPSVRSMISSHYRYR